MSALRLLPWDSEFFGFRVARIDGKSLTLAEAEALTAEADGLGVRCTYFEASAESAESWDAASRVGFEPIDIRVTFEARGPFPDAPRTLAGASDQDELLAIVREGVFGASRFFRDRRFPRPKALELFEIWLRRGLTEPHWFTVREPGGFAACDSRSIQLVAVSSAAQGAGVGQRLVAAALAEFTSRGVEQVSIATQGGNIAAQRAYVKVGFRPVSTGLWFHRWR